MTGLAIFLISVTIGDPFRRTTAKLKLDEITPITSFIKCLFNYIAL
jgi:hypothetical protein